MLGGLAALLRPRAGVDESVFEQLEETLLTADVGVTASENLVRGLRSSRDKKDLPAVLRRQMIDLLNRCAAPPLASAQPYVILMVGVNGVGKTTTTAKIAGLLQAKGHSVLLAAADTYRAAAVEQLQRWGERLSVPVIAQGQGADAAAVAHDAFVAARARNVDYLLVDTAGRQHTHQDLMAQLEKLKRVLGKLDPEAPHEVMQVLDAGTGQNALSQLRQFDQIVGVDSLCITKLDGTAKGGVLLAIAEQFPRPVRFIGVGETAADLRPFEPEAFVDALLPDEAG